MNLLFKYPTRERPNLFVNTLSKWLMMRSMKHEYKFLITMDNDDVTMQTPTIKDFLDCNDVVSYYGSHKSKIEAVNAGMHLAEDFDILILVSDDMIPLVNGYDDIICEEMQKNFPDLDGALHFNDGVNGPDLASLSIMGRKMYDSFGYIYHPTYKSVWCDNEFMAVTKAMGKYIYIDKVIVKHEWVGNGKCDSLLRKNESYFQQDQTNYETRKSKGFPKE